jgi:hypothetical protein
MLPTRYQLEEQPNWPAVPPPACAFTDWPRAKNELKLNYRVLCVIMDGELGSRAAEISMQPPAGSGRSRGESKSYSRSRRNKRKRYFGFIPSLRRSPCPSFPNSPLRPDTLYINVQRRHPVHAIFTHYKTYLFVESYDLFRRPGTRTRT